MTYPLWKSILTLAALICAGSIFLYRLWQGLLSHLRRARPRPPWKGWGVRLAGVLIYALGGRRVFRLPWIGIAHFLILWAFLWLLFSILAALTEGLLAYTCTGPCPPLFEFPAWFFFVQDILITGALAGVTYGLWLRLWVKPARYRGSREAFALRILIYIAVILVSLLVMNGLDIAAGRTLGGVARPISVLAGLPFLRLPPPVQGIIRETAFWLHLGVVLLFLAELPQGKHLHILTAFPAVLLRSLDPAGRLPEADEVEGLYGVNTVEHLHRKQVLDAYTCTECGRCQEVCPAYLSGAPLSPKRLMMDLRAGIDGPRLAGGVIEEDTIWACMTCLACETACPLFIDHVPLLVELRRRLVDEGRVEEPLQRAFSNAETCGNTFGLPAAERALWAQPLRPAIPDARRQPVEYLWFVGDTAACDPGLMPLTRLAAQVFQRLELDFGILYESEQTAANDLRRTGEEGLYQELRKRNLQVLAEAQYRSILTTDPHTYNTLRREYGLPDGVRVLHYTELLAEMLADGRLKFGRRLDEKVTYHDPCYLGRYNGINAAPRRLLHALACAMVEMAEHGEQAACCGAGGGRFWMSGSPGVHEPAAVRRLKQAAALPGVSTFVTACPKDYVIFREALGDCGLEGRLQVKDLMELIHQALC